MAQIYLISTDKLIDKQIGQNKYIKINKKSKKIAGIYNHKYFDRR